MIAFSRYMGIGALVGALLVLGLQFNPRVQAAPRTDIVFAPLTTVAQEGRDPFGIGAGNDGSVAIGYLSGSAPRTINIAQNSTLAGPFTMLLADLSPVHSGPNPDPVGLKHDAGGRLHAVWDHENQVPSGTEHVIYYGVKDPGPTAPWRIRPIPGTNLINDNREVAWAVQSTGRVYVLFGPYTTTFGAHLLYTDNQGASWSVGEEIPGPFVGTGLYPVMAVSPDGHILVAWHSAYEMVILTRVKDPVTGQWGDPTNISARGVQAASRYPRVAAAPDNGFRIIWNEEDPSQSGSPNCPDFGCRDVWYREWTPSGGWDARPFQLFSSPGNTSNSSLAVDASGYSHIVYDDSVLTPPAQITVQYLYGRGQTFSYPRTIGTEVGLLRTFHPEIDVNGAYAHVALVGADSNGGRAVYYTYANISTLPTPTPVASPTPCTAGQFSDVPPGAPFYTPIHDLVLRGAISGYADCTFRPGNNITRGQVAKVVILADSDKYQLINPTSASFADVPPASPFYPYIETAYHNGIVSGYTCGGAGEPCDDPHRPYFRPGAQVTRGQLSKMVDLGRQWPLVNPAVPTFTDVLPSHPFYQAIETAVAHGIISGYSDGTFRPYNNATRGQASKIIDLALYAEGTPTATATRTQRPATATTTAVLRAPEKQP